MQIRSHLLQSATRVALLLSLILSLAAVARAEPEPEGLSGEWGMPPLEGGAPTGRPPFVTSRPPPQTTTPGDGPIITLWYGETQIAGQRGDPQKWYNLLGNVSAASSLTYRLNGGPERPLALGSNDRRLAQPGDFNVEIDYTDLLPGANTVSLMATSSDGATAAVEVVIDYRGDTAAWTPQTYVYDWAAAGGVTGAAQVVDGLWALDDVDGDGAAEGVRPLVFDFDRLLAIGDLTWRDYTITVPVTIFGIDPSGYAAPSNGPGVGVLVRWAGHYDGENGITPYSGWRRLGALAWYRWSRKSGNYSEGLQLLGHKGRVLGTKARLLSPGETYLFKIEIQSAAAPNKAATYRFKVWPATAAEPSGWDIAKQGVAGEPSGGSLLLLAHHVDARFGAVRVDLSAVRPLPTLAVQATGNGSVALDPPGPVFRFGEDVVLTAIAGPGGAFSKWAGSLSGATNPAALELFESAAVTATFSGSAAVDRPFYISAAKKGKIAGIAFTPADILRFDPAHGWSLWFDASDVDIKKNVSAFQITADGDLLLSFAAAQPIPGLGKVAPHDVVRFTPTSLGDETAGTFTMELDGSAHDLTAAGEKIDALGLLDDGRLALSTSGNAAVGAGAGVLKTRSEDVLAFDAAGGWSLWFRGAAVPGLTKKNLAGLWLDPAGGDLYITLPGAFNLGGVKGNGRDIVRLRPDGAGGYAVELWWDGSAAGFPGNVDGVEMGGSPED